MLKQVADIVIRSSELMSEEDFRVELKGSLENIVTSSDIAVQAFLCDELRSLVPGCGFYCEEDNLEEKDKEYIWIIDPIDGTANYARGIRECGISVALAHNGTVELGVVYLPFLKELYCAEKGNGATLNGKPIHVSGRPFEDGLLCTAMSTYRKQYAAICNNIIMDTYMECNDFRRFGSSAVELCYLAKGQCELYFEFRLQSWDYAAAMLILREAGGYICNLDGNLPRLDGPDLVLAANCEESLQRLLTTTIKYVKETPSSSDTRAGGCLL